MPALPSPRSPKFLVFAALLTALVLVACTRAAPETPLVLPTLTATRPPALLPTAAATATNTPIPSPTPSPTPFTPFRAAAMVDNLLLRSNPGRLFPPLGMMPKDTSLLVLGQSPGGEWISVEMTGGERGWVFAQLLTSGQPLNLIPVIQPENVQLVKGHVVTAAGVPVTGIQFALVQGQGADSQRNDAMTDANGNFYAFMPLTAAGEWSISYVAIACTSNLMDANCNWINTAVTQPTPAGTTITLPHEATLEFVWK
jgi:hypothetical protein